MSYAHSYVHPSSIGDTPRSEEVVDRTFEKIDALYNAGRIGGYQVLLIEKEEHGEDVLVDCHPEVARLTAGRFPYVFARVQPVEGVFEDLDGLMGGDGYVRVA